jgi:ribosomal-protein-alanine N-acetyltransferase
LRASDLDRIQEIERASFGRDAYDRNLFAELFHKCGDTFLVVQRACGVCGYMVTCIGGRNPGKQPDRAELVSIAVDPTERGKGAASALMESTLRRLRRRGVVRLGLMVKVTNRKALAFYLKYGFRKVRIVRGYYEGRGDAWLMAKDLSARPSA